MNDKLREALEALADFKNHDGDEFCSRPTDERILKAAAFAREALAASKQEPRHKKCPKCGEAVMFVMGAECCTKNGCDWMTTTSKQEPHPPSRLCMCDDCKPSFEQEPQAQAGDPPAWRCGDHEFRKINGDWELHYLLVDDGIPQRYCDDMESAMLEAIAKKDAALKACVSAMTDAILSGKPANTWEMQFAVTQAKEACK